MLTSVNIKRILSLLMCLVLLAAVGLSARAETRTNPLGIPDDQYENIVEFLDTINPETGEPNGQQYCLGYGMAAYNESEEAKLNAIHNFVIISSPSSPFYPQPTVCGLRFYYPDYNDPNGCTTTIFVELYGYLNLSGTSIGEFVAAPDGLTGINLADCDQLRMFDFVGADDCREILLSGCSNLEKINLYRTNTRRLVVQPSGCDTPATIDVFGNGVIREAVYGDPRYVDVENNEFTFEAESFTRSFLGWYADGELYSSNNFCRISDFEHLTACFGGDTDGDGNISVADAVLIARSAIGVNSLSCDFNMADIDADGNISISDATSVMRFAMQVR